MAAQTLLGDLALINSQPPPDELGEYMRIRLERLNPDENLELWSRILGMCPDREGEDVIITIGARSLGVLLLFDNLNG